MGEELFDSRICNSKKDSIDDFVEPNSTQPFTEHYDLVQKIGEGGICEVYEVKDRNSGLHYAYKTPRIVIPEAIELIREEARTIQKMAAINNKYFPSFAVDLTSSERPGILTEFVPYSLEEQSGKFDYFKTICYFSDIPMTDVY